MRVVSMALIEAAFYLLALCSIALALVSRWSPALVYVNAVVLFVMLYLQIAAIPLNLNWSRNLYGHLLRRMLLLPRLHIIDLRDALSLRRPYSWRSRSDFVC